MQRSTGVTLVAIASALGAAFAFLMVALIMVGFNAAVSVPPQPGVNAAMLRIAQVGSLTMFGMIGLWAAITGVGLLKLKPWARWSVLVYAGLLLFVSLPAGLLMLFLPLPPAPNVTDETMTRIRVVTVVTYGVLAIFSGVLLYYFNRGSVRVQFLGGSAELKGGRPISVTLIGAYFLLGGLSCAVIMFLPMPAAFLGMTFEGWGAHLFYLLSAIAYIWIGVGLLRLLPASRIAAISLLAFGLVNSTIYLAIPGLEERIAATQSWFSNGLPVNTPFSSTPFTIGALLLTGLITGIVIWMLIRSRSAFQPPPIIEPTA